jgi:hypothetical protein
MKPPNKDGAEPGSSHAEETNTRNIGAGNETVKPDLDGNATNSLLPKQNFTPRSVRRLEAIGRDAPSLVGLFERAMSGRCSPRVAIKAQCLDCQGLDRQGVATCGDRCCPLWHFRPFQRRRAQ